MSDFPRGYFELPVIASAVAVAAEYGTFSGSPLLSTGTAWPSANRAIFVPFRLHAPFTVAKLWWANGGTVSGNVDCGIYSRGGARLTSTGSTAQSGASAIQSVTLSAPLMLSPGAYYMAMALDNATGQIMRRAQTVQLLQMMGCATQNSAFPLPSSFTLATPASAYFPLFGIAESVVI